MRVYNANNKSQVSQSSVPVLKSPSLQCHPFHAHIHALTEGQPTHTLTGWQPTHTLTGWQPTHTLTDLQLTHTLTGWQLTHTHTDRLAAHPADKGARRSERRGYLCREVADTEVLGREGGQRPEGGALHSGLTALCVAPQRRQATLLERLQDRHRLGSVGTNSGVSGHSGHGHWGQWARTLGSGVSGHGHWGQCARTMWSVGTDTGVSGHGHWGHCTRTLGSLCTDTAVSGHGHTGR